MLGWYSAEALDEGAEDDSSDCLNVYGLIFRTSLVFLGHADLLKSVTRNLAGWRRVCATSCFLFLSDQVHIPYWRREGQWSNPFLWWPAWDLRVLWGGVRSCWRCVLLRTIECNFFEWATLNLDVLDLPFILTTYSFLKLLPHDVITFDNLRLSYSDFISISNFVPTARDIYPPWPLCATINDEPYSRTRQPRCSYSSCRQLDSKSSHWATRFREWVCWTSVKPCLISACCGLTAPLRLSIFLLSLQLLYLIYALLLLKFLPAAHCEIAPTYN